MNKVTRKHKKNWLTITVFAFLCLPRVGRLTCFSVVTRYWIPAFCRWELRSLFCVISAEKSIPNKLSPLRHSSFKCSSQWQSVLYLIWESSRSQWFCTSLRTCWPRNNGSFDWVSHHPQSSPVSQTLHGRLYKVWFKKLSSSLRFLSRWNRRTLTKF